MPQFARTTALVLVLALASACAARTTTGLSQVGVAAVQTAERVESLFDDTNRLGLITDTDYAEALSVLDDIYESLGVAATALQAGHMQEWQIQMDALLVMVDQLAEISGRSPDVLAYTGLAIEAFRLALFSFGV